MAQTYFLGAIISLISIYLVSAKWGDYTVKSDLENLSDLMLYRARFLATETVNENYGIGEDRVVHLERIIKYMIEELESSPVNSRRHQKYSEKAIPLLQRANFKDSWMREMEQLKR